MNGLAPEQLHLLLQSAIQAPSADNKHPIRFQLGDQCILVHHARTEWGERGYKRVLALLSLGALAENLAIAASRFGIGTDFVLLPEPSQPSLVLRINLLPDSAQTDALWQAIPLRHTSRHILFRGPPLDADNFAQLDASIRPHPDANYIGLTKLLDANKP